MDDYGMKVQATVDLPSVKKIDEQIRALEKSISKLKVSGKFDDTTLKNLTNQLNTLKATVATANFSPAALKELTSQVENALKNINISGVNIGNINNGAKQTGQQIGSQINQGISQGMSSASRSTEKVLRDFSELNDAKRKFVDGHDLISKDDIADAERLYDTVRKAFSEFGQVTVSKGSMNDGSLENMRVKIEQVNGEMKITRDFMLYFNESKSGFRLVDDDTIRTTEKIIQHLNEEKNIINATNEEANAIKAKLAEQEKYYGKLGQATKEQIALEKQRITAGEKQLEILEEQTKRRDSRISYNEGRIDKKGLFDITRQRKQSDLKYSGQEKLDIAFGKEIDKSLTNLSKLKEKWQEQGIYVDEFKSKVELLEKSLNEITIGDVKGLNSFKEQISSLTTEAKQLSHINEIQLSTDVDTLTTKYQKFGVVSKEVEENLKELGIARKAALDSTNTDDTSSRLAKYNEVLKKTKTSIKELTTQEVSLYKRTAQMDGMRNWMLKNKAAVKLVGDEVDKLIKECETCDSIRFDGIKREFRELQTQAREAGKLGNSLWGSIKEQFEKFTQWFSVTSLTTNVLHIGRQMYDAVYDIDTAMTNLYKVTDETSQKYNQFLESSSKSAHELGRSISSLVEQTANWAKLGFSLDEAEQLAKISSIYANVGEVDNDTAVSDMVTAMKAFNIEVSNSITIIDMLNKLGNEFATSAAALGDGLSHSASAMATAGTDLNKTLAMLTGGTEITQNASEFGNFLKIGSMRIRGMKGSLEELGEEVDETVDSISKVQTQILNRTGGKVNIFDDMGNFRDYYDIMKDISEVYDELSDTDKADLTEILFGKQRGNQGAALIQAFQSGQIQKALEATLNAEGSAMEEQERWMDSLEAKTQQFEAAFQSLSNTVVDSNMLKSIVDLGTTGVSSFERFIKVLEHVNSLFGLTKNNNFFGSLGAVSGLIMNKMGIGERTIMFQW